MDTSGSLGALRFETDLAVADWVITSVRDFDEYVVGSQVPTGFGAYARILHPACRVVGSAEREVRWAEVARARGHPLTPDTSWDEIVADGDAGLCAPSRGSLPRPQRPGLAEVLERHTTTPEACWFAVWDGFGFDYESRRLPRLDMPNRPMILLAAALPAVITPLTEPPWEQSATLWWPKDRAWCVATDVDLESSYIGASEKCIDAILSDERLEAMRVSVEDQLA